MVAPASRLNRGFTLIELLIAVVIVSILTAIGFVSYLSFIDKSRINSAQADLAALSWSMKTSINVCFPIPRMISVPLLRLKPISVHGSLVLRLLISHFQVITLQPAHTR